MFFTASGRRIDFASGGLGPEDVFLPDIAHHLERIERFGGAGRERWTVLAHTLAVAAQAGESRTGHALLHDAAEAYIGDLVTPVKSLFPGFAQLETEVLQAIYSALALPLPDDGTRAAIKRADRLVFAAEAQLFGPPGLSAFLKNTAEPGTLASVRNIARLASEQRQTQFIEAFEAWQARASAP